MDTERVTIRQVESDAIDAVRETARYNRMTLGEAVTEAFNVWLTSLEEEADADQSPYLTPKPSRLAAMDA